MTALVRGIRSVEFDVAALEESIRFYRDVWKLDLVKQTAGSACFRGTGSYHHILAIHQASDRPAVRSLVYEAISRDAVHMIHERVTAQKVECETPGPLAREGGGFGFGCKDAEGRNLVIS